MRLLVTLTTGYKVELVCHPAALTGDDPVKDLVDELDGMRWAPTAGGAYIRTDAIIALEVHRDEHDLPPARDPAKATA